MISNSIIFMGFVNCFVPLQGVFVGIYSTVFIRDPDSVSACLYRQPVCRFAELRLNPGSFICLYKTTIQSILQI